MNNNKGILVDPSAREKLRIELERNLCTESFSEFCRRSWHAQSIEKLKWSWHMDLICDVLQLVSAGKVKKVIINVPPGMSKTSLVAILYPAWDWIKNPKRQFIYATYAQKISNNAAMKHRDLILSNWYSSRFGPLSPTNITIDRNSLRQKEDFCNNHAGRRKSVGTGSGITGYHANCIIFDDLSPAQHAVGPASFAAESIAKATSYLKDVLWSRQILAAQKGNETSFVGICQRLHPKDVAQWCIDQGDWLHVNLPMEYDPENPCQIWYNPSTDEYCSGKQPSDDWIIWRKDHRTMPEELLAPQIVDEEKLHGIKKSMSPEAYITQYNQVPTEASTAKVDINKFLRHQLSDNSSILAKNGQIIVSVDATFGASEKSDYVVMQVWKEAEGCHYLIDQVRKRLDFADTIDVLKELLQQYSAYGYVTCVVEAKANGQAILSQFVKNVQGLPKVKFDPFNPQGNKQARLSSILPLLHSGKISIPEWSPFVDVFVQELRWFPTQGPGIHDDCVDAFSQAMIWYSQKAAGYSINRLKQINAGFAASRPQNNFRR
jgi:predicted phage terminase large subunit-like protein